MHNLPKIFKKNFVETPLLETYEAGKIHLSSGKIVASDPLITPDKPPFSQKFPIGDFPVFVYKEKDSNCIAYVEIQFSKEEVETWQMATSDGQNEKELQKGEIFGYPVESGMGCFMDFEAQQLLNDLEQKLFHNKGADFMGIYEEFFHDYFFDENGAIDQFASLKPNEEKEVNIIAFETGYGEGFYATYIGFNKEHQPIKIISEFIEMEIY